MQDNLLPNGTTTDLSLQGRVSNVPFSDLNLAGSQGVPPPAIIARPADRPTVNEPTFTEPDMRVPELTPDDLAEPGITLHPAFTLDPQVPDLKLYDHPEGIDIYTHALLTKPAEDQLPVYERPDGLDTTRTEMEPDPLLPDLQHPDLTQQVHMLDRPGDLDGSAMRVLHLDATYQQLADKTYPAVFMDQSSVNSTRTRHMDLLMRGLDAQE